MNKTSISTPHAPAAIGPYSQAVTCDGWLYISGQVPLDPTSGKLVSDAITEQTERVLENISSILDAAGTSFESVVKTTIYLTNLADFATVNGVYAKHVGEPPPARATVQVAALPLGARIEIDAIARLA